MLIFLYDTMKEKIKKLQELREEAKLGGGLKGIETQHSKGKLTARERIDLLIDSGSFNELDMFVRHRGTHFNVYKRRIA